MTGSPTSGLPAQTVRLPAVLDALEMTAQFVRELAAAADLPADRTVQLRLAVEELVTNVAVHGYEERGVPPGEVELLGSVERRRLRLTIVDAAPPFDPTTAADPADLDRPLAERAPGGLGLFLARSAVDEMTYEYRGGRNRTTLVMQRAGVPRGGRT